MSRRLLFAAFEREADLLGAVRWARAREIPLVDAYAPYPVHGLPEAMGLRPSRLPWACLAFGLLGVAGGMWLQVWTSAVDWPLDVGGKPLDSIPAFVPVAFELVILLAGLGTFAALLVAGLRRRGMAPPPRVTDDRLVLVLAEGGAGHDGEALAAELTADHGAVQVVERLEGGR